jgi:uncharacterized membrane protein HdeD (DUF308 family)
MSQGEVGPVTPGVDDRRELRRLWIWVLLLGVVLFLLGLAALAHVFTATVLSVLVYGWLLLAGGVVQTVYAVWARRWSGFFLYLLDGLLCLLVGAFLVRHPVLGADILTFFLAVFFFIGGFLHVLASLIWGLPHRFWEVITGLITVALGVLIWSGWPDTSYWTIGLFVGVELLFNGWSLIMLAVIARRALSPAA